MYCFINNVNHLLQLITYVDIKNVIQLLNVIRLCKLQLILINNNVSVSNQP